MSSDKPSENGPQRISHQISRPTQLLVDLNQIAENYHRIQHFCDRPLMAVVKADAYGHGIIEVSRRLEREGVAYLAVAYLEEALLLRESSIKTSILVMGGILGEQIPFYLKHGITLTASSIDKLQSIEQISMELGIRARVHLKIDTGMGRIGVQDTTAETFLIAARKCEHIDIEGIYTHFANADSLDQSDTIVQWNRFNAVLALAESLDLSIPMQHVANSGAVIQSPECAATMIRVGLLLYGVYPNVGMDRRISILPAIKWKSQIVYFKVVQPGRPVGYGSHWVSDELERVVTIPVGYGDGYHRRMSGKAQVLIRGKKYPVIGSICMDQIMVSIGWDEAYNGEEVILLGNQGEEVIHSSDLATWAETIPYEILTSINSRVTRVYIN